MGYSSRFLKDWSTVRKVQRGAEKRKTAQEIPFKDFLVAAVTKKSAQAWMTTSTVKRSLITAMTMR